MNGNRIVAAVYGFILLFVCHNTAYGQNLSSLIDAIKDVETKLIKVINEESAARKESDANLKKRIPNGAGKTMVQVKTDSTLKRDVDYLNKSIGTLEMNQSSIQKNIEKTQSELEKIQAQKCNGTGENDKKIKVLANSLMQLIKELKSVLNDGMDKTKEAMELGGVVTLDAEIDPEDAQTTEMTRSVM